MSHLILRGMLARSFPYSGILQAGPLAVLEDTCASVAAALGCRAPTKRRKAELVGGFTSALEGIYKSGLCMDITVCRQDRSTEGPVPAQVHRQPHRESHCLASDSSLTRNSPSHPQIWSSSNPYEVTAASKADFQAEQRHPGPSPQPGLPGSPQSKYTDLQ